MIVYIVLESSTLCHAGEIFSKFLITNIFSKATIVLAGKLSILLLKSFRLFFLQIDKSADRSSREKLKNTAKI